MYRCKYIFIAYIHMLKNWQFFWIRCVQCMHTMCAIVDEFLFFCLCLMEGMGSRAPYTSHQPSATLRISFSFKMTWCPVINHPPSNVFLISGSFKNKKLEVDSSLFWNGFQGKCRYISIPSPFSTKLCQDLPFFADRLKFGRIWRGTKLPTARWSSRRVGSLVAFGSSGGQHD